jgi:5-formyltetrahydrofolate cyclo-ligase
MITKNKHDKENYRLSLKRLRKSLPAADVNTFSEIIAEKLIQAVDWPKIFSVHIYRSVETWGEVNTEPIISHIETKYPEIEIVQPERKLNQEIPLEEFDLIIVPVLGFDQNKNRLGLGGGYYDRFLAGQPKALKIGLAYELSFVKAGLPQESHDIRLDKIITQKRIIA